MKRLGISDGQAEAVRMSLANRAYTNYMLSVGYSGGVPEVLAAILACSWSYAEIGERARRRAGRCGASLLRGMDHRLRR